MRVVQTKISHAQYYRPPPMTRGIFARIYEFCSRRTLVGLSVDTIFFGYLLIGIFIFPRIGRYIFRYKKVGRDATRARTRGLRKASARLGFVFFRYAISAFSSYSSLPLASFLRIRKVS